MLRSRSYATEECIFGIMEMLSWSSVTEQERRYWPRMQRMIRVLNIRLTCRILWGKSGVMSTKDSQNSVLSLKALFRDIFSLGFGPFRWVCTSGLDEDLRLTDQLAMDVILECSKQGDSELRMI